MAKLDKLLDQAQEHLDEGEEVLAAIKGTYETKKMGNDWNRAGILAATNHRVVFFAKKMVAMTSRCFRTRPSLPSRWARG